MQGHRDSNHHTRTSSLKKEGQCLRKTTHTGDIQIMVHTVKNHCKSIPAQLHHQVKSSAPYIINSSSISTLFPVQVAQGGIHNYFPCATTHSCLSPLPNHVQQFVTQGRFQFLIQNCLFWLLLNFYKSKFPIFWHTFCFQIQHLINL